MREPVRQLTEDMISETIAVASSILSDCIPTYKQPNIVKINVSKARSYWGQIRVLPDGYGLRISNTFEYIPTTELFNKRLMSCILHELIHTQDGCMNHGKKFKRFAQIVNQKWPGYDVSTSTSEEEYGIASKQLKAKYVVTCKACGQKYYYQRRPKYYKNMNRYMCCGKCNASKFVVEAVV